MCTYFMFALENVDDYYYEIFDTDEHLSCSYGNKMNKVS